MSAEATTKKTGAVAYVKKHKWWFIIPLGLLALFLLKCHAMPFKYVDDSKFTYKQRRAIVKIMKTMEADSVQRKALEDAAKEQKKPYRQLLEEAAAAKFLADNG